MDLSSILVILCMVALFVLAILFIFKEGGWQGGGCNGNCGSCASGCSTHPKKNDEET